jgi:signal transduction histidine kinase
MEMFMKGSIRRQISFVFILFMASAIVLSAFLNYFFLEKYYQQNKIDDMFVIYNRLNEVSANGELFVEKNFDDEFSDFDMELMQVANTYNVDVLILDKNGRDKICTTKLERILASQLNGYAEADMVRHEETLINEKNYIVVITPDQITGTEYMEMWGFLDSKDIFLIRTPMEGIRASVQIANQFLLYIGAILLVIGGIAIYFITKRISEPILQITKVSEKMAKMNFDVKYKGKSRNEIALLGKNINQLSDALEKNISELKTANNELKKDIERKEQIDDKRKEFISNVSHELKTPIALIQGYAEGLEENINDEDGSREYYCDVIIDEAKKLNSIVGHLLTLNQLEEGNSVMTFERFDLRILIKNTIQSMKILLEQKGIKTILELDKPIFVWADEFKIEEVVQNYLSNAINHCKGKMEICISAEEEDGLVRVSVFNTGEQIPNKYSSFIWDKFYKVDKARTREYGGSGVGLSIVKAIMESMNRKFGVVNLNTGVSFWFELETK